MGSRKSSRTERIAWMVRRPQLWQGWPEVEPERPDERHGERWRAVVESLKRLGFIARATHWRAVDVPELVARARRAQQLIAAGHPEEKAVADADGVRP